MFVELHARSAFSFLEAAALPEALAERAAALGQPSVALLDADGVYGAPRLYRACTRLGLSARVGAEVTLADGSRLPLLAEDPEGYQNLCRLLTRVKMRAPKGEGAATLDELSEFAGGLVCLTGGGRGPVATVLEREGAPAGRAQQRALHEERGHHGAALLRLPGGGGEHRRAGPAARVHPEGPGLPLPGVPAAARGDPDRLPA